MRQTMTHVLTSQNKRAKAASPTTSFPCSASTEKVEKHDRLKQ